MITRLACYAGWWIAVCLVCNLARAQASIVPSPHGTMIAQSAAEPHPTVVPTLADTYGRLNIQAEQMRAGDRVAMTALTQQMFYSTGIPPQIADAFGVTSRIVQAEADYRAGMHPAVHESDIVRAVNNLAASLAAPPWTHTTQPEIRKLRMHLLVSMPHLFVNHQMPTDKQPYSILSSDMSPIEACWLATRLLREKIATSDYQFTPEELASGQFKDPRILQTAHLSRTDQLLDMINGRTQTVSIRDLLLASSNFLNDLGISGRIVPDGLERFLAPANKVSTKGAH